MTIGVGSIVILRSECVLPEGERTYMTVVRSAKDKLQGAGNNLVMVEADVLWMNADHCLQGADIPVSALIEVIPQDAKYNG